MSLRRHGGVGCGLGVAPGLCPSCRQRAAGGLLPRAPCTQPSVSSCRCVLHPHHGPWPRPARQLPAKHKWGRVGGMRRQGGPAGVGGRWRWSYQLSRSKKAVGLAAALCTCIRARCYTGTRRAVCCGSVSYMAARYGNRGSTAPAVLRLEPVCICACGPSSRYCTIIQVQVPHTQTTHLGAPRPNNVVTVIDTAAKHPASNPPRPHDAVRSAPWPIPSRQWMHPAASIRTHTTAGLSPNECLLNTATLLFDHAFRCCAACSFDSRAVGLHNKPAQHHHNTDHNTAGPQASIAWCAPHTTTIRHRAPLVLHTFHPPCSRSCPYPLLPLATALWQARPCPPTSAMGQLHPQLQSYPHGNPAPPPALACRASQHGPLKAWTPLHPAHCAAVLASRPPWFTNPKPLPPLPLSPRWAGPLTVGRAP